MATTLGVLQCLVRSCEVDTWLDGQLQREAAVSSVMQLLDDPESPLSEPAVARAVVAHMPVDHALFLSSSMPVRDVGAYAAQRAGGPLVGANRGVSGIDGVVASAAGFAVGLNRAVTLLSGDLALLHDLNGLHFLQRHPVIVVVINNNGAGIFHFLPIVDQADVFEPYFGTPHGLTFERAAEMFGIPYHCPADLASFTAAHRSAVEEGRSCLIEVRTDRRENAALHADLDSRVRAALAQ